MNEPTLKELAQRLAAVEADRDELKLRVDKLEGAQRVIDERILATFKRNA